MHQQILEQEHEADDLRAEMNKMTHKHRWLVDDQTLDLQEYAQHKDAVKTELEDVVWEKTEANVMLGLMKKQFGVLIVEVEHLRRQKI
ncbi:hypothetical protein BU17DRAFT_85174 [Hysterangium stoloniferum]|nr:hypothetical protein BU17DRAFT_85174 [Hysterangium stoloniferum]